jgi:hypothetical protein
VIVREAIPRHIREVVVRRDMNFCRYCGRRVKSFHLDHVVPVSMGGSNDTSNLVVACSPCNLRKGASIWTPIELKVHIQRSKEALTLELFRHQPGTRVHARPKRKPGPRTLNSRDLEQMNKPGQSHVDHRVNRV